MAMAAALLLAGCASAATPAPSPSPSSPTASTSAATSVYPSQAAAIDALGHFYRQYVSAVDVVLQDGGQGVERLKSYLAPALYAAEVKEMDALRRSERHTSGKAEVTKVSAQRIDLMTGRSSLYICVDQSRVRVIAKGGEDVTPATRPDTQTLVVAFSRAGGSPRIERSEPWHGDPLC